MGIPARQEQTCPQPELMVPISLKVGPGRPDIHMFVPPMRPLTCVNPIQLLLQTRLEGLKLLLVPEKTAN